MRHLIVRRRTTLAIAVAAGLGLAHGRLAAQDGTRFRTGVELVNVTATITDPSGRFVSGLKPADFLVYEDDARVEITHFSAERVPVSLGIVLDTSASMRGQKIVAARAALKRFLDDLLAPGDEIFLYRFDTVPHLVEGWTTDRTRVTSALQQIQPDGSTALYDAVLQALPLLSSGRHAKKALLVISDGMDTNSHADFTVVKQALRESEALVYAIGIDAPSTLTVSGRTPLAGLTSVRYQRGRPRPPMRMPSPFPRRPPAPRPPPVPWSPPGKGAPWPPPGAPVNPPGDKGSSAGTAETIDLPALQDITDDTGGRTEVVRDPRDLDQATARIADELSQQYYLAYSSTGHRDGRWHTIRVEVRDPALRVRARRGYTAPSDASPRDAARAHGAANVSGETARW